MHSLERVPFWTTINASPYRARASRPSAPLKEASRLLLDVASTPPVSGGELPASDSFRQHALSRRGGCASIRRSRSSAAQTGWLVKGRAASSYAREAVLILFEITNHPVCAAKERDLFINGAATPPLKGAEWIRLATNPSNPLRVASCETVLVSA